MQDGEFSPDDWERVKRVFEHALTREPGERRALLEQLGDSGSPIRREVESLLEAHELPGDFLEPLPVNTRRSAAEEDAPDNYGHLGPYRLLEICGQGGMGVVYRAERADREFSRQVAIKVLSRTTGAMLEGRFRLERQILAGLSHPGITTLFDGGTTCDGLPYLVMEYVQGKPITTHCRENALPTRQRLALFLDVCKAAGYAHERKIVHRDLKPSNVLVTDEGAPKLLDFGIAKVLSEETDAGGTPSTRIMTPEYASPEQIRGEAITAATDVHALGVLLYELVTDRHPFAHAVSSPEQLARAICEEEPARPGPELCSHGTSPQPGPDFSAGLSRILSKALDKDPARRYATARQMADDVERCMEGVPVRATAASRLSRMLRALRRRWRMAAAVAAATALTLALAHLMMTRPRANLLSTGDTPSPIPAANEYFERAQLISTAHWDLDRIIAMLEKSLAADPKFTAARVNLGFYHLLMLDGGYSDDGKWLDKAEQELRQALREEPGYRKTHAFLAAVAYYRSRCGETAEHVRAAKKADPSEMEAPIWMINCLVMNDNHEEAKRMSKELLAQTPTFFPARMNLASILRDQGDLRGAIEESNKVLEQNPNLVYSIATKVQAYLDLGDTAAARRILDGVEEKWRGNYLIRLPAALVLAREGRLREALDSLTPDVMNWASRVPHCTLWVAEVLAEAGEKDRALDWMRRAVSGGDRRRSWFVQNPYLKPLRAREDYKRLIGSVRQLSW